MVNGKYSKVFSSNKASSIKAPSFVKTSNMNNKQQTSPIKQEAQQKPKSKGLFDMLNIGNIDMDSDRSMLLMLLALLSGKDNEADELLMLALMYIML